MTDQSISAVMPQGNKTTLRNCFAKRSHLIADGNQGNLESSGASQIDYQPQKPCCTNAWLTVILQSIVGFMD